jgi:hypothetical protein
MKISPRFAAALVLTILLQHISAQNLGAIKKKLTSFEAKDIVPIPIVSTNVRV